MPYRTLSVGTLSDLLDIPHDGPEGPPVVLPPREAQALTRPPFRATNPYTKAKTGTSRVVRSRQQRAGGGAKPGAGPARRSSPSRRPKAKGAETGSGVSRIGRVRPLQREGVKWHPWRGQGPRGFGKRGGTARAFRAPSLRWSDRWFVRYGGGRGFCVEEVSIWRSRRSDPGGFPAMEEEILDALGEDRCVRAVGRGAARRTTRSFSTRAADGQRPAGLPPRPGEGF